MKVTLIDYGAGNPTSVERALQRLGAESIRANTPDCIASASTLLLPGVGHFGTLIRALDQRRMRRPILDVIHRGVPFLGICLGLHALYASSDEAPELEGLGLVPQQVRELPRHVKLPHMGWNQLRATNPANPSRLLAGIEPAAHFYFAHSYAALASDQDDLSAATCSHGANFVAVLESRNIFAVQFHPEKSGTAGARLLQNFLRLAA
jgi:imidazole glycerol phosphate synthase glutamine amidotransferase subunit